MSERRSKARARALRAAQVVTIAGAMLGVGCNESHVPLADSSTSDSMIADAVITNPDGNVPDANVPDANVPDANVPDANVPDANVPDANVPDATVAMCPSDWNSCSGECTAMSESCCTAAGGLYSPDIGECCPGCAVGPLAPPELMS